MDDMKNELERAARHYTPPPDSLGRLDEANARKARSDKIGALLVGVGIIGALIFAFVTVGAQKGTVQPAAGGGGDTARPVINGDIMYAKRVDNGWSLFALDPETGVERQITHGYRDYGSDWSPDGTQIVYDSEVEGSGANNIVVANADGSSPVVIADEGSVPAWSPDGTRIVFARADIGNMVSLGGGGSGTAFYLYVMNSDGTDVRQLTRGEHSDYSPVWSPDGSRIAFEREGEGLFVMNSDGSSITRLTEPGLEIFGAPDWSPDGTSIAIAVNGVDGDKPGGVLLVPADRAGTPTLIPGTEAKYPDYVSSPAWSPDGQWIAYVHGYPGKVVITHPDGSGEHVLQPDAGQDSLEDPTWGVAAPSRSP